MRARRSPGTAEPNGQCTDNDRINDFEGTRTTIHRVRTAPAQDVDGDTLVRVQVVVVNRGLRRGDEQDGSLVRVQDEACHRGW
jgi:hypothetical protein